MMPNLRSHSSLETVFDAVVDWVNRYRLALKDQRSFAKLDPDAAIAIAKDLGVAPSDIAVLAHKGPAATAALKKLLTALGVDVALFDKMDQRFARDLKWICISCDNKARCRRAIAAGTAKQDYHEFCPNALTIDDVFLTNGK